MAVGLNFLDTNILIYAVGDDPKSQVAQALMAEHFVLSVQALNEFANIGHRKLGLDWLQIKAVLEDFSRLASQVVELDVRKSMAALGLLARYNFSFYDALMIAAALDANCSRFYSEDLQHGLVIDKRLEVLNPFL